MEVNLNPIDKQVEILNKLAGVMMRSPDTDYESLTCRFEVSIKDESVGQEFSFKKDGEQISGLLDDPDWAVMDWVFDLHNEMNAHTGGDWIAFTLTIDGDGKATTKFEYPEEKQANG
jgi:hypothetical protein